MTPTNPIKAIRTRTGETQAALAKRLGFSLRTLQGWELGKQPTILMHLAILVREQTRINNLPAGGAPSHSSPLHAVGGHLSPPTREK